MKFIKQTRCSACKGVAVVYKPKDNYEFHCFGCGEHRKDVDPERHPDIIKEAFFAILIRLYPEKDWKTAIPETANWRDLQIAALGMIDLNALERERFRRFFRENHGDEALQLSFYHLLKNS